MDVLAFQRKWIDASRQKERSAYVTLDRAAWTASGWPADKISADVDDVVILSRLLELDQERAD